MGIPQSIALSPILKWYTGLSFRGKKTAKRFRVMLLYLKTCRFLAPRSHNLVLRRIAKGYADILCPKGLAGSKALSEPVQKTSSD